MSKRNRKPNASPMQVVAKVQFYLVTLRGQGTVRVRAASKGAAYQGALAVLRHEGAIAVNEAPLSLSIEIDRPKVSF
jgi:hypothetical protein